MLTSKMKLVLIDLLVAISIIGVLIVLLLPLRQSAIITIMIALFLLAIWGASKAKDMEMSANSDRRLNGLKEEETTTLPE